MQWQFLAREVKGHVVIGLGLRGSRQTAAYICMLTIVYQHAGERMLRCCREADGDHNAAGESKQLRQSVDLFIVQRPRDGVLSVSPWASQGKLSRLEHFENGRVKDESSRQRRPGAPPSLTTATNNCSFERLQTAINLYRLVIDYLR